MSHVNIEQLERLLVEDLVEDETGFDQAEYDHFLRVRGILPFLFGRIR